MAQPLVIQILARVLARFRARFLALWRWLTECPTHARTHTRTHTVCIPFWGGLLDGRTVDLTARDLAFHRARGLYLAGGAYRYDPVRQRFAWHQHVPPLKRAA